MSNYKSSEDLIYSSKEVQQAEMAKISAIADSAIKAIKTLILGSKLLEKVDVKIKKPQLAKLDVGIKSATALPEHQVQIELSSQKKLPYVENDKDINSPQRLNEIVVELSSNEPKKLPEKELNLEKKRATKPRIEVQISQLNRPGDVRELAQTLSHEGYKISEINLAMKQGKYYSHIKATHGVKQAERTLEHLIKSAARKVLAARNSQQEKTIDIQVQRVIDFEPER